MIAHPPETEKLDFVLLEACGAHALEDREPTSLRKIRRRPLARLSTWKNRPLHRHVAVAA